MIRDRSLGMSMAESAGFEAVLGDIVGRLIRDLDEVISLIQRPLGLQPSDSEHDETKPDLQPAFA
jgi:hypothetical protein